MARHKNCKIEKGIDKKKLIKKGWSLAEIKDALKKLDASEDKKTSFVKKLDFAVYWLILAIVVATNFVLSVFLIPLLLVLSGPYLVFMIIFLGLVFGYFFTEIIKEVEHFQHEKIIIAELLIPAIALISIYLITQVTNEFAVLAELKGGIHNPIAVSFLYVLAFSIPRIYYVLMQKEEEKDLSAVQVKRKVSV